MLNNRRTDGMTVIQAMHCESTGPDCTQNLDANRATCSYIQAGRCGAVSSNIFLLLKVMTTSVGIRSSCLRSNLK